MAEKKRLKILLPAERLALAKVAALEAGAELYDMKIVGQDGGEALLQLRDTPSGGVAWVEVFWSRNPQNVREAAGRRRGRLVR